MPRKNYELFTPGIDAHGQKRKNTIEEGEDSPRTAAKKKNARVICSFELSDKAYHVKGGELEKERLQKEMEAAKRNRENGDLPKWGAQFSETAAEERMDEKEKLKKNKEKQKGLVRLETVVADKVKEKVKEKDMEKVKRLEESGKSVKKKALEFLEDYKKEHGEKPVAEELETFDKWFAHPDDVPLDGSKLNSRYPKRSSQGSQFAAKTVLDNSPQTRAPQRSRPVSASLRSD